MRTVDVGGSSIAYDMAGDGQPSIVFVAGGGGDRSQFSSIFDRVAELGTVVAFDRGGCGASGPVELGNDGLGWRVRELQAFLVEVKLPPPFLLIGFSIGALIAELYCIEHPGLVCGLVSLDGDDGIPVDLPPWPEFPPEVEQQAVAKLYANVPPALFDQWSESAHKSSAAIQAESADRQSAFEKRFQAHAHGRAPNIPFVHIGALDHFFGPEDLIPLSADEIRQRVAEKHRRNISRFGRGEYVEANRSGHFVQFDEPDLVLEAVRRLVEAI